MDETIISSMKKYLAKLRRDPAQKVQAPLADSFRRGGLVGDAEQTAFIGIDRHPSYLLCHEVLGKIYLRQGRLEKARDELEKVARIVQRNVELSRVLGKIYAELDQEDQAKELLEFVLEQDPFDFEVKNALIAIEKKKTAPPPKVIEKPAQDEVEEAKAEATKKVWDIESIIASIEEPASDPKPRAQYERATDDTLDALESLEGTIDVEADKILEGWTEEEAAQDARRRASLTERAEIYSDKDMQLHAAASVGQVHMELHLLDEALVVTRTMLNREPEDPDLQEIFDKFKQAVDEKETELDRMEDLDLGVGL
jgi:tetratricopeptide (TPR) repeat protein